jgi:hypothetical protein
VEQLEPRLEAVGESFIRHTGQNEQSIDSLERSIDQVGQRIDEDEWRQHR